jgi:outer membrane lipoprotein-sorting protein
MPTTGRQECRRHIVRVPSPCRDDRRTVGVDVNQRDVSAVNSEQRRKWLPAVVVPAAVGVVALGGGIVATADTDLPDRTASEILAMVAEAEVTSFSGRFDASFALGLPQLPGAEGSAQGPTGHGAASARGGEALEHGVAPAGLAELLAGLSGTHEARVFVDGRDRARLQVFDGTEERNVVRNGDEIWAYDSAENRAVHAVIPADASQHGAPWSGSHDCGTLPGDLTTPDQLAEHLLSELDPSTLVTVEQGTRVAGREAYTLRLDPRTQYTLVEDVTIAVDAATGTPLSVRVDAVGQETAAISVGFTEFAPEAPDQGLFAFTPPEGAEVEEIRPSEQWNGPTKHDGEAKHGDHESGLDVVQGSGWDAVVVIPADEVPDDFAASPLVEQYATDTDAGRVLSTPLATVLLADDGRVLAGSVPLERLLDVAGTE